MIYDNPNSFGKTYYEHRKALELSKDDFIEFKNYVEAAGFDFISSFTDENSLDFLCDIEISGLKIASQRTADIPLLEKTAQTNLPVILSTGMSDITDVDRAVNILKNNPELFLLQCTSTYPCSEEDINLNVIQTYKDRYKDIVTDYGFSGHHTGIAPDLASFMLGARIIERHYTLSRGMKGTDHAASLEQKGVENVLRYISQMKKSLGSSDKIILDSELPAIKKLRNDLK